MPETLVGRDDELAKLAAAVGRAQRAGPGLVLLDGMPGVGVSALGRSALALAGRAGLNTWQGHCSAHGSPYGPFAEAAGRGLAGDDPAERDMLLRRLDELALVIPGTGLTPPAPLGDPQLERARLDIGFVTLIARRARLRGLALLVEHAHEADEASLGLLWRLVYSVEDEPLLLVLTTHPDVAGLAQVLDDIRDSPWWLERLPVQPLPDAHALELLTRRLGGAPEPELAARILARCGGRPLFLETVAQSLLDDERVQLADGLVRLPGAAPEIPPDVGELLTTQLVTLGDAERRVVEALAIAGSRCRAAILAGATGLPGRELEAALEQLDRRRMLAPDDPDGFALAHGLLAEAAVSALSAPAARRLHSALFAALLQADPADPRLPVHAVAAGDDVDAATAAGVLVAAGRRARDLGATKDAICFLEAAGPLLPQSDSAGLAGIRHDLGLLYVSAGRGEDAARELEASLSLYRLLADPDAAGRVLTELGHLAWVMGDRPAAERRLREAAEELAALGPTPAMAELLSVRMDHALRSGDLAELAPAAGEQAALAAHLDSPGLAIRALLARGTVELAGEHMADGERLLGQAVELAEEAAEPLLLLEATDRLAVAAALQGDLPGMLRLSRRGLDLVRRLGVPNREAWPRMRLAVARLLAGDWVTALEQAEAAVALSARFPDTPARADALAVRSWVLTLHGRLDDAAASLAAAEDALRASGETRPVAVVALASCALASSRGEPGRAVEAGAVLGDAHACWVGPASVLAFGEALIADGRPDVALRLAADLRGLRMRTSAGDVIADCIVAAADPARGLLEAAMAGLDRLGFVFHAACLRLRLAEAIGADDAVRAVALAKEAQAVLERLGSRDQSRRARRILREHGVVPSRGGARKATGATLSPRQLEVALLVAAGDTNAEIAESLFISPRTVATHLEHAYRRLGLGSRAALTRYLADAGLL